jgi:cytidylate kinase
MNGRWVMAVAVDVSKHAAEARMLFSDLAHRLRESTALAPEEVRLGPYVTISRMAGAGGSTVAGLLADELGWTVLGRELVDEMAHQLKLEPQVLKLMDETRSNWFREAILGLLESRLEVQHGFVARLGRVMGLAAHKGRVVFVGRAGHLLLPAGDGVRIRLVASEDFRAERMAVRRETNVGEARKHNAELDTARRDFIHRNFRADVDDPLTYDVVINTESLGFDGAVRLVRQALQERGLE